MDVNERYIHEVDVVLMGFPMGFPMIHDVPSGKHTKNYGTSPFLMGKLTINGNFSGFPK